MARQTFLFMMVFMTGLFTSPALYAQMVEVEDEQPATGRQRASEYFQKRSQNQPQSTSTSSRVVNSSGDPRFLALHIGGFLDSNSYNWGRSDQSDTGKLNLGVTYRMGEWVNSMDFLFRTEFTTFGLDEGRAQKLSFLALLTFPDANSRFPLFFGAGLGPAVFTRQIADESVLALDYQVIAGARFFDVIETVGFQVELGLKNSIHLLDDGQFSGFFLGVGTVFAF